MAIDMTQFYQVFFEESDEHLASMESLLVAMDIAAPDEEDVNAVFRAAHSIKGSSATFGFDDLTEVTHVMESLLDRVRNGQQAMTDAIVDACLKAGDVLKNLLSAHRGQGVADHEAARAVRARLEALLNGETMAASSTPSAASAAPRASHAKPALPCFLIDFQLQCLPDRHAVLLESLFNELREQGELTVLRAGSDSEPSQIQLHTKLDADTLHKLLEYTVDAETLCIRESAPAHIEADTSAPAPQEEAAYGFFDVSAASVSKASTEEAFGFFEPLPKAEESYGFFEPVLPKEDAYGFFEPLAKPEEAYGFFEPLSKKEEAYGFFEPLPKKEEAYGFFEPLTPPSAAAPIRREQEAGYGFFDLSSLPADADKVPPPAAVLRAIATPTSAAATPPATPPQASAPTPAASANTDAGSIRVAVGKLDQMINLVGELVITQAMLTQAASGVDPVLFEDLLNNLNQLARNTRDLQASVMSVRMLPISTVFSRFPRVVRDLSQKLDKKVQLLLTGEHTELDKTLVERIADPLTHLVRNSLDHGIEAPAERLAAGKAEQGTLTLRAYHQSGNVVIEVADDGGGLRRDKILAKARERGLRVSDNMSDQDVWMLIFEPGFSTADVVTDVSGRGVGMDVVRKNIMALNGRIEIDSAAGLGTRVTVRLPLTLAILDGMSVSVGEERYIIPLDAIVESLQPDASMIKSISGKECLLRVRGEYLPILSLREAFGVPGNDPAHTDGILVIIESDGVKAAVFVEQLNAQHQVVIKSLEANYRRVAGVAGVTIMGDGRVACIVDAAAVVGMARRTLANAA
ncbi:chemotaxis protein CheW [Uliginosibacterium sediminicola]|uniref:Chemotaxis protein CheA n=1 Tax=Uliginosibacterium sediminicola TaxID=2024550 RepID=A0ABU9YVD3_9RHOO